MQKTSMQHFHEDEIILMQDDTKKEMYKILSGKVAVYFKYGLPEEYLIGILSEQRCFGELSILCGKPSTYTVVALEDTLVLCITENTFDDFIKNNSHNAISIMKNLANTVNTLSMNLSMIHEDMSTIKNEKDHPQKIEDITLKVRQYAARDSIAKALFSVTI